MRLGSTGKTAGFSLPFSGQSGKILYIQKGDTNKSYLIACTENEVSLQRTRFPDKEKK
jgi:hypothetical protein